MFSQTSIASCSNSLFSCETMRQMTDKRRHPSMERLLAAAAERGVAGPSALAKAMNESDQTVTNWSSRGVSKAGAIKAQGIFGISAAHIIAGAVLAIPEGSYIDDATPAAAIDLDNNPEYPAIRRVEFKLSAGASGFGVEYRDNDGAPIVFQRKWYSDNGFEPGHLFAVRVANGSMEPGLYDGDTVVVNTKSTQPKDGIVFAVNYEGEMVIKRLIRDGGQWWLSSDNPNQQRYPRKLCDEHSLLIGEVVHKQSMRI